MSTVLGSCIPRATPIIVKSIGVRCLDILVHVCVLLMVVCGVEPSFHVVPILAHCPDTLDAPRYGPRLDNSKTRQPVSMPNVFLSTREEERLM